ICSRNSDLPFMTASLYKLILMADIYRKIEHGSLGQQDLIELDWSVFSDDGEAYFGWDQIGNAFTVQEYLFAAGAYSSNAAAWTLFTLTSTDDLAETVAAIGLTRTYMVVGLSSIPAWPFQGGADSSADDDALATAFVESWGAWDDAVSITTPRDMAIYFHALLTRTLLSPWISGQITDILSQQQVRDRIPALLPAGTKTVNKTGNLDSIVNDAGIIELPGDDRIVVLLSEAMPNDTRATLILQRLALIATGATDIPPLDVPDPKGLDAIDTTAPATWDPGSVTPGAEGPSDGTGGPSDEDPGDAPVEPTPDATDDGG
ncbi:MAG: serine hydrolase, partial [Thermomicrobiales bacterium]